MKKILLKSTIISAIILLIIYAIVYLKSAQLFRWWEYGLLFILIYAVSFWEFFSSHKQEQGGKAGYKTEMIGSIIFGAISLYLAISNFCHLTSSRSWILAVVFSIAFPCQVYSAIQSYKKYKEEE